MAAHRVVLAEYFTSEDITLLFVAREDFREPQVVPLDMSLHDLRECIATQFGHSDVIRQQPDLGTAKWNELVAPFVKPILQWADRGDTIWFVPHDILHSVPLHAVWIDGEYLIERNPVCFSPSASVMKFCQARRRTPTGRAIVFGDSIGDLHHARAEAESVAGIFGCSSTVGRDATKTRLLEELSASANGIDVLHLACHGRLDRDQPMDSGIVLASENATEAGEEPARLTAAEILQLELNTGLVTLSACDSGVNTRRSGDEMLGLTRALIYAGAPSVLVSLWAVDDLSTRVLMEQFYATYYREFDCLDSKPTKAEALQKAIVHVMKLTRNDLQQWPDAELPRDLSPPKSSGAAHSLSSIAENDCPFAHPYYWGAFSLVGDWR